MSDSQKVQAAFVGMVACVLLSFLALGLAYSRGRVPLGDYVQALEGDRNFKNTLLQQCNQQLMKGSQDAAAVQADAARLLDNLLYAIEGGEDPLRPSLSDAKWEAQQRIAEWSQK